MSDLLAVLRALPVVAVLGVVAPAAAATTGCSPSPPRDRPIRFLHTFGPAETELFNAAMAERGIAVEASLVPFARGHQMIAEQLAGHARCPDLVRIDATWLAGLAAAGVLGEVPAALAALDWVPEAAALAQIGGRWWGLPQALDGLVVMRDLADPAPASPGIDDLVAAARARRTEARRYPLGVRVDGYWFVPWLRDAGGELAAPAGIAGPGGVRAIARLAALFGDVAPPLPPSGSEDRDELARWRDHEVAYWITGPWQFGGLPDRDRVAVTALAHAPRGGQLLVVPRCTAHPEDGWRLARELTSPEVLARYAERFAIIPTRRAALADAPPLSRAAYAALRDATMLPREPVTPLLFDDLNAALAAAVAGDATAEEVADGVQRGWQRLIERELAGPAQARPR